GVLFVNILSASQLGLTQGVCAAIWRLFSLSTDPEAVAFHYHTSCVAHVCRVGEPASTKAALLRYYREWLSPALLSGALAELGRRQELSAQAVTRLQQNIDRCTDDQGRWTFLRSGPTTSLIKEHEHGERVPETRSALPRDGPSIGPCESIS